MPRKQLSLPELQTTLLFQTILSATTLNFNHSLPVGSHWKIFRRTKGIFFAAIS